MKRLRHVVLVTILAIDACASPITLAEPRADAGIPEDDSGSAGGPSDPDVGSFGERPDVDLGDERLNLGNEPD